MLTQQQDKTRATEDDVKEQERIANSLEAELNSYKVQHSQHAQLWSNTQCCTFIQFCALTRQTF
jgi:hypothetical protein